MERLIILARRVARVGVWFGGGLILLATFIIGIEVVIRKAFLITIGGADELSGFALAIGSSWAFGFALLERAHIRIDSLYIILPVRICALLDILGLGVFTLFMGLVTWHGWGVFAQSFEVGARLLSPLATPVMIPQFLWVLGLFLFLLIAVLLLTRAVMSFVTGDAIAVQRLIGSKTVSEELEEELQQVERHSTTR